MGISNFWLKKNNTKESNSLEAKTKEPQWADKQNLVETNYTNL